MNRIYKHTFYCLIFLIIYSSNTQAQHKDTLNVMTYNIWNGFDWGKDELRKEKVIKWIKSEDTDVLALQELNAYTPEKLSNDARKWGHAYSLLLKKQGYSVGLTSKKPILLKERVREGMWHGMLHCETFGIDFFVVHLSPSVQKFRKKEADLILNKIKSCKNKNYIVLGDFNAHSPFDGDYLKSNKLLLNKYLKGDNNPENKHKNTLNQNYDYSVIASFMSIPTIDVCALFIDSNKRYSFPTPALIGKGKYLKKEEVNDFNERIDYILVSPNLAKSCINTTIHNTKDTHYLSDHFPVSAQFILEKK